jgi:hypothetical protein
MVFLLKSDKSVAMSKICHNGIIYLVKSKFVRCLVIGIKYEKEMKRTFEIINISNEKGSKRNSRKIYFSTRKIKWE